MATAAWDQNRTLYHKTAIAIHKYIASEKRPLSSVDVNRPLEVFNVVMMQKIATNVATTYTLINKSHQAELGFLSLGLILRGIVSDIINYKYLKQIHHLLGEHAFNKEIDILELEFAHAYRKIEESERKLGAVNSETLNKFESNFKRLFGKFIKNGKLIEKKKVRSEIFWPTLREYLKSNGVDPNINIDSESGKLKFIRDTNIEQLKIVYTYLSQFQHFSITSFNFYTQRDFNKANPFFTLMILFLAVVTSIEIIHDLSQDDNSIKELTGIAQEISSLSATFSPSG
jgi:hypothetical protein